MLIKPLSGSLKVKGHVTSNNTEISTQISFYSISVFCDIFTYISLNHDNGAVEALYFVITYELVFSVAC